MWNRIAPMSIFFAFAACVLFTIAAGMTFLTGNDQAVELALVGVGALVAALVSLKILPKYEVQIVESGIDLLGAQTTVPWNAFGGLKYGAWACEPSMVPAVGRKPVSLHVDSQNLRLDAGLGEAPGQFYSRLVSAFSQNYQPVLRGKLKSRYDALVQKYGASKVLGSASVGLRDGRMRIRGRVVCSFLAWGIIGIPVAFLPQSAGLGAVVATVCPIIAFSLFIIWARDLSKYRNSNVTDFGLLASPDGIALHTKALTGEMAWDELLKMELRPGPKNPMNLRIRLAGVDVLLDNSFELPLWYIEKKCLEVMQHSRLQDRDDLQVDGKPASQPPPRLSNPSRNPFSPPAEI